MSQFPEPREDNGFLAEHVAILRNSLRHWTGRELVPPRMTDLEAARYIFEAPFVVASHDTAKDPLFNYANQTGLALFAMSWDEFTGLPSRLSAETALREARAAVMAEVARQGFVEHYRGIRIGRKGRRFLIEDAVIWNLLTPEDYPYGQAVMFPHWKFL